VIFPLVQPRDVIAIHIGDAPPFFGRVEEILPDVKRGWFTLRFLALTPERQEITWILEASQIDGEAFTMGGASVRIERLPDPVPVEPPEPEPEAPRPAGKKGRVIAFPGPKEKP